MEFNIFEYVRVRKEVTHATMLYFIIVHYEESRGVLCEEHLYDSHNDEDFISLVRMYGAETAIDIYKHGRFCFGGNAHPQPMAVDANYLEKFVKDTIDLDYLKEQFKNNENLDDWGDIVRVEDVMTDYGTYITDEVNDREMRFALELEVFYTAKHRYGVKITDAETRWNKNVVADTKEELATKLMNEIGTYYEMLDDIAEHENEEE